MTAPVVTLRGVSQRYGATVALEGIDLQVPAARMVGLIGPDGVGKSSLMALVAGARAVQQGQVMVLGGDMADGRHRDEVCPRIAYMPQGLGKNLYPTLSVEENLQFFGRLFGHDATERRRRIDDLTRSTGLHPFLARPAGKLSGGMKQKLALCCALIHDPDLLILDEPTVGLDPKQIIEIRNLIKSLGRNHTIILSSHILPEVQAVCERVIVMNNGCLVADGATDTLAHDLSAEHRIIARIDGPESEILQAIRGMEHIVEVYSLGEKEKGVFEISIEGEPNYDLFRKAPIPSFFPGPAAPPGSFGASDFTPAGFKDHPPR